MLQHNQFLADWQGETVLPIAVLILLNCRNAVLTVDCNPLEQLNKARCKRGKPPLCEYKVLQLNLTEEERVKAKQSASSDRDIRMHWRRGHFKHRKTGLFWWNPHLAGQKQLGMIEKSYVA